MKKKLLINEILDKISDLNEMGDAKSGSLFIHGDADSETALSNIKGNAEILASAFGTVMDQNKEMNTVMLSLFGAYLVQNPEQKAEFFRGIEITEFPFNMN